MGACVLKSANMLLVKKLKKHIECISSTDWRNLTKFMAFVLLGTRLNCLNFEVKRSKIKVMVDQMWSKRWRHLRQLTVRFGLVGFFYIFFSL